MSENAVLKGAMSEDAVRAGAICKAAVIADPDGQPVPNAIVSLLTGSAPRETIATAKTASDGRFRIGPRAPVARAWLLVDAPGFGREHREGVSIFTNAVNEIRIVVAPGRTVLGRVLGVDGQPAADASITFHLYRVLKGKAGVVGDIGSEGRTKTDSRGEFRVPDVPPCAFFVEARMTDTVFAWLQADIQPGHGMHTLQTLRMSPDVPIAGIIHNSKGEPLAGIVVNTDFVDGPTAKSDASGRFVLRGFPADQVPRVCLEIAVPGFARTIVPVGENREPLDIVLKRQQWISGRVVDAETGAPVPIEKMILCVSTRRADGEFNRSNCRPVPFEQPEKGQFRVAYDTLNEYHITVMAEGFEDAEAFVESPQEYQDIGGILTKTRREGSKAVAAVVPVPKIRGTLTRDGRPVTSAWVSVVSKREERKLSNVFVRRGRAVAADPWVPRSVVSSSEGLYSLDASDQGTWYVLIEEPNRSATIRGPFELKLNQMLKLDAELADGGSIKGRVQGIPVDSAGYWWVVAFDKTIWRTEARVALDGTFQLDGLPPGEYGLKVGHEGYQDAAVPDGLADGALQNMANPWQGAALVNVRRGETVTGVVVDAPKVTPDDELHNTKAAAADK